MHRLVILFILLVGLVGGYYLVNHTVTNLKPKAAYDAPSSSKLVSPNQYDAPTKITAGSIFGGNFILEDISREVGFVTTIKTTDEAVTVEFDPKKPDEEEQEKKAKAVFIKMAQDEQYYPQIKMLMYLLANEFDSVTNTPHVDSFYAMCDYFPESVLIKIGANRTVLFGDGERDLKCSDPKPTAAQLGEVYGLPYRQGIAYNKIPARHLLTFLELANTVRDQREEFLDPRSLAYEVIPFVGSYLEAKQTPGLDPHEVYFKIGALGMVKTIIIIFGGEIVGVGAAGSAAIMPAAVRSTVSEFAIYVGERLVGNVVPNQVLRMSESKVFSNIIEIAREESLKEGQKFSVKAMLTPGQQSHKSIEDIKKDVGSITVDPVADLH